MADYQSSYTGAQVDAATAFGHDPDTEPHLNSQAGVTSDGIYQADRAVEAKIVNRNLLNNPYFRIDQRQGYVVPPNKNYYSDTSLTTLVGQTTEYVTVTAKASGYNTIKISGTDYYVAVADCVRGYANLPAKIGFDRWYNNVQSTITLLMQDGIKLDFTQSYGQIRQTVPKADLVGKTLTVSVIFDSILLTASGILSTSYVQSEIVDSSYIRFFYNNLTDNVDVEVVTTKTGGVIVSAVKLELGSISTLQAEMDSGNYDEDADLRECREYLRVDEAQSKAIGNLQTFSSNGDFVGYIPSSIDMKGIPTLTYENCYFAVEGAAHYPITSLFSSTYGCGGKATTSVPASTMGFLLIGDTGVTGRLIRSCEL